MTTATSDNGFVGIPANKKVVVIAGGTFNYVTTHFALAAPAFGKIMEDLCEPIIDRFNKMDLMFVPTKMAGNTILQTHVEGNTYSQTEVPTPITTNDDLSKFVDGLIADPDVRVVFFAAAVCDFKAKEVYNYDAAWGTKWTRPIGKYAGRLSSTTDMETIIELVPDDKIIQKIRAKRKDIFLVGFKATANASPEEQFKQGLNLCKKSSCNLVLTNDVVTKVNMIITPEETTYPEDKSLCTNREAVIKELVDIAYFRSHLTFTQSTVVAGERVAWLEEGQSGGLVPKALFDSVNYCIGGTAYKPFNGCTAGHFAFKLADNEFVTSIRKTDFNDLKNVGLVRVKTSGPDTVIAYGAKPSVGGQSQRIIFNDHPGFDCVVHFHCPLKENHPDDIPQVSQREVECGSHQCGGQTSAGLKQFGNLKAVYLKKHGPNIVFPKNIDPQEVIDFIDRNFDLEKKTN